MRINTNFQLHRYVVSGFDPDGKFQQKTISYHLDVSSKESKADEELWKEQVENRYINENHWKNYRIRLVAKYAMITDEDK